MLTLDKLKIVVPYADCVGEIDKTKFNTLSKDGVVTAYKYQQVSPYLLYIEQDLEDDELIIEFTGKILGPRYSELINKMNIRQCIENINALKLCTLDIDSILNDAKVVKADVTQDAEYPDRRPASQLRRRGRRGPWVKTGPRYCRRKEKKTSSPALLSESITINISTQHDKNPPCTVYEGIRP